MLNYVFDTEALLSQKLVKLAQRNERDIRQLLNTKKRLTSKPYSLKNSIELRKIVLQNNFCYDKSKEIARARSLRKCHNNITLKRRPFESYDYWVRVLDQCDNLPTKVWRDKKCRIYSINHKFCDDLFPPPQRVPELMSRFHIWANNSDKLHFLIRAFAFQGAIFNIHPLSDGNGVVAQSYSSAFLESQLSGISNVFHPLFLCFLDYKNHTLSLQKSKKLKTLYPFIEHNLRLLSKCLTAIKL